MARPAVAFGVLAAVVALALYKKDELIMMVKSVSNSGLKFLASIEGFSAMPYKDAQGYSVGFGHFILPSDSFVYPMDKSQGYDLLYQDVTLATDKINSLVKVQLNQNQYDALTSFVYNVGGGAFAKSTLLKKLNAGDYTGAANQFPVWKYSDGTVLAALVSRRVAEKTLFEKV